MMVCIDKPNFVFVRDAVKRRHERQSFIWEVSYPTPRAALPSRLLAEGTALHRSKDFAVAPAGLLRRLARACARAPFSFESLCVSAETGVSVRTSRLAPDGRYPLLSCRERCRPQPVFGLSSMSLAAHSDCQMHLCII